MPIGAVYNDMECDLQPQIEANIQKSQFFLIFVERTSLAKYKTTTKSLFTSLGTNYPMYILRLSYE